MIPFSPASPVEQFAVRLRTSVLIGLWCRSKHLYLKLPAMDFRATREAVVQSVPGQQDVDTCRHEPQQNNHPRRSQRNHAPESVRQNKNNSANAWLLAGSTWLLAWKQTFGNSIHWTMAGSHPHLGAPGQFTVLLHLSWCLHMWLHEAAHKGTSRIVTPQHPCWCSWHTSCKPA